jgi:hypothetical protein
VELGMGTKCVAWGSRKVSFQMESGDFLRVENFLWVSKLKRNVLSVLAIEEKGYAIFF